LSVPTVSWYLPGKPPGTALTWVGAMPATRAPIAGAGMSRRLHLKLQPAASTGEALGPFGFRTGRRGRRHLALTAQIGVVVGSHRATNRVWRRGGLERLRLNARWDDCGRAWIGSTILP